MKLSDWLTRERMERAELARRLNVHAVTVSKWVTGQMMPRAGKAAQIQIMTNGEVTAVDLQSAYLARQHGAATIPSVAQSVSGIENPMRCPNDRSR